MSRHVVIMSRLLPEIGWHVAETRSAAEPEGGRHDDCKHGLDARRQVEQSGCAGVAQARGLGAGDMRDTVQIHVTADLPIRVRALTYANRAEIRFGKAFPVVLLVDSDAIAVLGKQLHEAETALSAATRTDYGGEAPETTD
ncbi:hypothetical protein L3Q65_38055 [Amycolatopsis sp. FU40]|uniref:hypothetical protein n=1 Tax=Amycolatopsis sp. FU40 TaxID=2914159 RepID=UPI001F202F93|nr:hypothetical protein [Amycolatopsis sp. FU40]UKD53650.1 hypothetical protein L3Q65_38055 [Amycolatopsis sp. FU40]